MSKSYKPAWHLKGKPYDVQVEAMRRGHDKERFGQFLQQGLGKTALMLNEYIEQFSDYDTVIMICPNSFKGDWAAAPGDWGVNIETRVWGKDEFRAGTASTPVINVINFEAARASGYEAIRKLMGRRPCVLAVDESSMIKNYKSMTAKAVLDLSKRAKVVRLLNGTPLSQNVMDLFPQLKCLGELDGINPFAFRNRFAVMGGWMGKQVIGVRNEEELHRIQSRVSFRALKEDWSDLPPKQVVQSRLEMTDRQRKHYREMYEDFITMLKGHEFTADMVISRMDKLRQVTSGVLIDGDKYVFIEEMSKNPKARAALDLLETGSGKMVVVHWYRATGGALYDFFADQGLQPARLRGGMTSEEITAEKKRFNNDPNCRVLVGQITTSMMGHTLLGGEGDDRCHKMFYHDLTFSFRDYDQMNDRIHRGVQDKLCLYYHPVMSPVDEAQVKALQTKASLADAVVNVVRGRPGSPIPPS